MAAPMPDEAPVMRRCMVNSFVSGKGRSGKQVRTLLYPERSSPAMHNSDEHLVRYGERDYWLSSA